MKTRSPERHSCRPSPYPPVQPSRSAMHHRRAHLGHGRAGGRIARPGPPSAAAQRARSSTVDHSWPAGRHRAGVVARLLAQRVVPRVHDVAARERLRPAGTLVRSMPSGSSSRFRTASDQLCAGQSGHDAAQQPVGEVRVVEPVRTAEGDLAAVTPASRSATDPPAWRSHHGAVRLALQAGGVAEQLRAAAPRPRRSRADGRRAGRRGRAGPRPAAPGPARRSGSW